MIETVQRAIAKTQFEGVSAICAAFPKLVGRHIMGPNPVRYYLARTHADEVRQWFESPGDPESGRLPASYRSGVLHQLSKTIMDRTVQRLEEASGDPAVPALAFRVGSAVLVTRMPDLQPVSHRLGQVPDIGNDEVAGILGVGRHPLVNAAGAWTPESRLFLAVDPAEHYEPSYAVPLSFLKQHFPSVQRV